MLIAKWQERTNIMSVVVAEVVVVLFRFGSWAFYFQFFLVTERCFYEKKLVVAFSVFLYHVAFSLC